VVETALPLTVHRPIEFFYDGNLEVAQYYDPVPVSGCMPGSIANRVTYSESTSDTKQQSVTITVSTNWSNAHGVTNATNWMEGYTEGMSTSSTVSDTASLSETETTGESYGVSYNHSDSNSVGYSSTDGENWGFDYSEGTTNSEATERLEHMSNDVNLSDTVTVKGDVSIPGVASVGGSNALTAGVAHGTMSGEHTTNRTDTRVDQGYSTGGMHSESTNFGSTTTDSTGTTMTGNYSLSSTNSSSRTMSDTEGRSESRTYSLGGSSSESNVVTEGMSESEAMTWVESSTHTTLTSYSGFIPVDRYGVFYRQTVRLVRKGYVRSYDLCGRSEIQGDMSFNEWTWAPALAIGESCSPSLPKPDMPKAECLIAPCN